jgi:hypothetical protein
MSRTKDGVIPRSNVSVRMPSGAAVPRLGHAGRASGEYEIIGPRGGDTGKERTVVRGEPLPPTPKPGMGYSIRRPAHKDTDKKK